MMKQILRKKSVYYSSMCRSFLVEYYWGRIVATLLLKPLLQVPITYRHGGPKLGKIVY